MCRTGQKVCPKQNIPNNTINVSSLPVMCTENTTICNATCTDIGYYAGNIHLDFSMCIAQHTCYCSCEVYNRDICEQNCSKKYQTPIEGYKNEIGCETCKCQCKNPECSSECSPYQFRYINTTNICPKYQCDCPDVDCDALCFGEGLGIAVRMNSSGCIVCNGCRKTVIAGEQLFQMY